MDLKNKVIAVAIIILTSLVVIYGINTVYPRPEYSDFCNFSERPSFVQTKEQCETSGGRWNSYESDDLGEKTIKGYCDLEYNCSKEYEGAGENYARNVFIIALPLAIAIIVLGALIFGLEAVGAGLMGGGIVTLIYGVGGYWRYSVNLVKFVLSLIGLIVVIGTAYWINKKSGKK